jgi:hypothetical protein
MPSRPELDQVKTPLAFFALALLVTEGLLTVLVTRAQGLDFTILVIGMLLVLFVLIASVFLFFRDGVPDTYTNLARGAEALLCEDLNNREAYYHKLRELIHDARRVLDTTWGPDPVEPISVEADARQAYIKARTQAVEKGTEYKELFSLTDRRRERARESVDLSQSHPNYQIRIPKGLSRVVSMLDFMVVDSDKVILAHVDSAGAKPEFRYLFIQCKQIAQLFAEFFDDYWRTAKKMTLATVGEPALDEPGESG